MQESVAGVENVMSSGMYRRSNLIVKRMLSKIQGLAHTSVKLMQVPSGGQLVLHAITLGVDSACSLLTVELCHCIIILQPVHLDNGHTRAYEIRSLFQDHQPDIVVLEP